MSILANKRVSIDTSSGEPEKDANSLLIELDKGASYFNSANVN